MGEEALWSQSLYRETVGLIIIFLLAIGLALFFLRKNNLKMTAAWVSVKSWIFVAPFILFFVGLPAPWPLAVLTVIAIYAAKTFYRMVGMYHRSWFVWLTYTFIFALGLMIHFEHTHYVNIMPMLFLLACCFVPFFRNSFSHMIQYTALSLLCFIFIGWGFLHFGLILSLEKGIYVALYLYILGEFSFNTTIFFGRYIGKIKLMDKISPRLTLEGFLASLAVTTLLAWGLRHMLPVRSEPYWIAASLILSIFGRCGDLIMSVIRRDLGIKDTGIFIIGRDDLLARVDKFVFAAPLFYYLFFILQRYFPNA